MSTESAETTEALRTQSALSKMFGRGLLYTAVYAAQSVTTVLITPLITRALGPSGYGQLAAVMAVGQFAQLVAGLGLVAAVQRHYADEGGDHETRGLIAVCALASLIFTGAIYGTLPFWAPVLGFTLPANALRFGIGWAGLSAIGVTVASLLRAQDRLGAFLVVMGIQVIGSQVVGLALVFSVSRSVSTYFVGLLIGQTVGVIVALVLVRPRLGGIWAWKITQRALAFSLPFVPHMMAGLVLNLGDRLVVQRDLGQTAVGRYQLAYNASAILILLLGMLNQAWEPGIFSLKEDRLRRAVLAQSRDQVFYLEVPLLLGTVWTAPVILRILAPASFAPNGLLTVVTLVAISAIPYAAYLANLRTLMAYRKTKSLAWAAPLCAIANVILNLALVPLLGINGSAIATLICYIMLAGLTRVVSSRSVRLNRTTLHVWIALLIAVGASFASVLLPLSSPLELAARLIVGLLCGAWAALFVRRIVASRNVSAQKDRDRRDWQKGLHAALFGPEMIVVAPVTPISAEMNERTGRLGHDLWIDHP